MNKNERANRITATIKDLGIPANLLGYHYLRYGIELMMDDMTLMSGITKRLYPMIAEHFGTTTTRAERAIRHAIEQGWNKGSLDVMDKIFGYSTNPRKGGPTNSEFIVTVADYLTMEGNNEQ